MTDSWPPGPRRLPIPAGEVHLWRAELAREQARPMLLDVLARYLDLEPAAIELERGDNGKPGLPAPAPLEFNLSHSCGLVLVAVARDHPVGVDVEATTRQRDFVALAERALPQAVADQLRSAASDRQAAFFYAAWADYEARVKCGGGGIAGGPGELPLTGVAVDVGAGYAAALAVPGRSMPPLRRFRFA